MIIRGDTKNGWTSYVCSKCQGLWHVHAHEDPKKITAHSKAECADVQRERDERMKLITGSPRSRTRAPERSSTKEG